MHHKPHLSAEELLLATDGELPPLREAHLKICDACRARLLELEQTTDEIASHQRRRFDPWILSIEASRTRLQSELARMAVPRVLWRRYAGAAAAALAIVGVAISYFAILSHAGQAVPVSFPEPSLTPGAVAVTSADLVCRTPRPKNRIVPASLRRKVFEEYGIPAAEPRAYEVDYLITPALGGSDDIRNLWPQSNSAAVWNARIKDALEDRLHDLVCDGSLDLATAQHELAADWIAAYRKYFHTDTPLGDAR